MTAQMLAARTRLARLTVLTGSRISRVGHSIEAIVIAAGGSVPAFSTEQPARLTRIHELTFLPPSYFSRGGHLRVLPRLHLRTTAQGGARNALSTLVQPWLKGRRVPIARTRKG